MRVQPERTLFQWLEENAENRPQAVALLGGSFSITYKELKEKVLSLATGFAGLGIGKGDVVAAQLPNCPEFIITFLACAARGAIFQTLHMPYRKTELAELLNHGEAKAVVALGQFKGYSPVGEIAELELPHLQNILYVGEKSDAALSFNEVANTPPSQSCVVRCQMDDPYLLLYTSGTTASPKGVPHNYRGFLDNSWKTASEFNFKEGDRICSLAPFSHLYGLMIVHLALATGATNALVPAFNPETFVADMTLLKPTALFAAPAHFAPFIAANRLESTLFDATKLICLSGSAVAPELARSVDNLLLNGAVIQLWGMSELQAGAYGRPNDPLRERLETTGRASPGAELRLVNENEAPCTMGEEGALEIRGPSIFPGYLKNKAETENSFTKDGWFKTGDLAVLDENGYFRLTGRTKEVINRGGVKYNPLDIELLLMQLPAIEICAIVPVPDPVLGEKGCLCVQLAPNCNFSLTEATTLLDTNNIAKYKWPERLEIITDMPMTPTRKIMRGRLSAALTNE